jgi:hypothetical protein
MPVTSLVTPYRVSPYYYGTAFGFSGLGFYSGYYGYYDPFLYGGYYDPFLFGYGGGYRYGNGYGYGYGNGVYGNGYGFGPGPYAVSPSSPDSASSLAPPDSASSVAPYPLDPQGPTGGLRLKVEPRDAQVYVDGYYAGIVDDFDGHFQHLTLAAGPHHIEVRAPGHEPLAFDVAIEPHHTTVYQGTLVR